ncbi:putative F-box domain, leucine-rich repeat domain, L domain-containing protein [Rosa chinensis]|uniref:Putative F-box domain, leucine-rich repeat domain, L domain-containing protein n=1 Tax=Rosa chinensis TaxID=74649 RepID=A0A2P6R3K7_ROSCH|nr:putative F-box domain, leucine-rich repeat domain, L domain-containing protein [Rosa chinensis]
MAISTLGSPHMADLHNLPDLVIDKILRLLPTKAAIQVSFLSKQWQAAVSSLPELNFNEDDDFDRHNLNRFGHYQHQDQHKRFINFLEGYLDYREKYDRKELLDKLSLHMRMYGLGDYSTITKWLKYACERGLKELDISPKMNPKQYGIVSEHAVESYFDYNRFYRMPWVAINASAKSLTSLKLAYVRIPDVRARGFSTPGRFFPSLKILSFKTARFFTDQELYSVLFECPSIEYLSLTDCSIGNSKCYVCCSSLKSLEVKYCQLDDIRVVHAFNLESFTFVSLPDSKCEKMILNNSFNLKYINICVDYLGEFSLLGSHRALEAKIINQYVEFFEFFDGYLSANVSVKAYEATILVGELFDPEWFSSYSTHFPSLMSFFGRFSCCFKINLYNQDVHALIVPKNYRKTSFELLPNTSNLQAWMPNPPIVGSREYLELKDSLQWIAPFAQILIMPVDVEEDRKKVGQRGSPAAIDE